MVGLRQSYQDTPPCTSGQSIKASTIVNYDSKVLSFYSLQLYFESQITILSV